MDLNSAKKHIQEEIPKLLSNIQETQKHFAALDLQSHSITTQTGLDLLEKYKQALHDMIDMHFDHLKLSYLSLASTIPCKESIHVLNNYIEDVKKDLKQQEQKFDSDANEFDVKSYKSKQFSLKATKLENILETVQTQKGEPTFEEPEIVVNNNVYSRLYHTLCEFITTSLYQNMPSQQQLEKKGQLLIDMPDYFMTPDRVLPVINEEQKSLSLYSLLYDKTTSINLNFSAEIPYSPSVIITPESTIYLSGGVLSNGTLTNKTYHFQTNKDSLGDLDNMIVKKVGHSLCYVNNNESGGYIFSIGGRVNDGVRTKICEKYSILADKWEKIALMNSARSRPAVAPFNGDSIYAYYGTGSDMHNVITCERYDINLNVWRNIGISNDFSGFEVSYAGAVQINQDQILVFGGFYEDDQQKGSLNFSKKILTFNVNNNTFRLMQDQLPLDFSLSCSSTPIVDNKEVYCLGFFLQSLKPQSSRFLDCDYVLKISNENSEVKNMILGTKKQLGQNAKSMASSPLKK